MKTVIEMAREAGVVPYVFASVDEECLFRLKAFAKLVRADEREACAKVVEQGHYAETRAGHAATIRARSNT